MLYLGSPVSHKFPDIVAKPRLREKMAGRIRWDLEYIARWSFMGDVRICFRTLSRSLGEDGAY